MCAAIRPSLYWVSWKFPISRYVVDAQVLPIFEGVKPILELKVVARGLLGG